MERSPTSLVFSKGVDERWEASSLPEGAAALIENWIPEEIGGLRARVGWLNASLTGAPAAPRRARGIGYMGAPIARFVVPNRTVNGYDFLHIPKATLAGGAWTALESVAVADPTKFVSFATGLGNIFYTTNDFAAIRRWDGVGAPAAVAGSKPGKFVYFHKNRLFSGGHPDYPYRLWYSDLGDYTTWGANSYIDVGKDDGEGLETAVTFDNGLLMAKENTLWFLTGGGPDTFQLHPLDAGGSAPGNTLVATPYGAVICGRESVWLWKGGPPVPISKQIETSYGMTGAFLSAAYVDDYCKIVDEGTGVMFVVNLATGVWHVEKISSAAEAPAVLASQGQYELAGPRAAVNGSLLRYRTFPALARVRDAGFAETFKVRTPEIWLGGAFGPGTLRHVHMKIRQRGGTAAEEGLVVTPIFDGVAADPETIAPRATPQVFRETLSLGTDAYSFQLEVQLVVGAAGAAVMDIEAIDIEYDQENPR